MKTSGEERYKKVVSYVKVTDTKAKPKAKPAAKKTDKKKPGTK